MEAVMARNSVVLFASLAALAGLLAGCRVEKTTNGDSKDVQIVTPFGGMNKDDDKHKSADVNMSFGGFKLRVKVAGFRTDDSTDKVVAFYRDGLKKFGDVISCHDNQPMGSPAKTSEGLGCDNNHGGHVTVEDKPSTHLIELKAGSEQHQHIVTIDPDGGGTKFSLVALDLPGKITYDSDENTDKRQ
jgi:hypothetical protein